MPQVTPPSSIPVLILAGGMGSRLSEETVLKPKPLLEIGEIPILLHLMRHYYRFGFNDFVVCAGYRAWDIKQFFLNYEFRTNHLQIDHRTQSHEAPTVLGRNESQEKWRIRVIDTGLETMTGARIAMALDEVSRTDSFENFALTYGDGLTDASLADELKFHCEHGKIGTVLGAKPAARFGELEAQASGEVISFLEKPEQKQSFINGGFFLFKKEFRSYLSADPSCVLEREPLVKLTADRQLRMYRHTGFWRPMDTLRDKIELQALWESGKAPWAAPKNVK